VLVTIGVVGLVLALAIPSLAGARSRAREARCLSNLKGLATAVELYTQRFSSRYPFAEAGSRLDMSPDHDGGTVLQIEKNWDVVLNWPGLLHHVAPWREFYPTWVCPGARRAPGAPWRSADTTPYTMGPSYIYVRAFLARPETWLAGTPPSPTLIGPVTTADVLFPSSKVVFYDEELVHLAARDDRDTSPMLFADGHVKVRRFSHARRPGVNVLLETSTPLHDTLGGVRGVDY
jgi:prepilin-type processing-associated H-X9-DG protein